MREAFPFRISLVIAMFFGTIPANAQDAAFQAGTSGFNIPQNQNRSLQRFQSRPVSELSKLLYLVDRLGENEIEIIYEKNTYSSRFILPVARWYINQHYNRKDSAETWLSKWCYRSLGSGDPIWVKYQDGSLRSAKEILLEELGHLDSLHNPDQPENHV